MPFSEKTDQERLKLLIEAGHGCILLPTTEEDEAMSLVVKVAVASGHELLGWTAVDGLTKSLASGEGERVPDTEPPAAALFGLSQLKEPKVAVFRDLAEHLKDPKTLRALRDAIANARRVGGALVLVDSSEDYPQSIKDHATKFELSLPEEDELEKLVRETLKSTHQKMPIRAKLTVSEMTAIVKNLTGLTRRQARQIIIDSVAVDRQFNADDINHIMAMKRKALSEEGLLEYVETPVSLDEIGGLKHLKRWLKMRRDANTDEAEKFGIKPPRGVLMLGVQGAGKSLCAKAIAAAWNRPLLRMDPNALYDRYIGESERRLRSALHQAEAMAPIVLWIDEIEKGFASAGAASNDGGLSRRMFGSLLTWMQEHEEPVFMVATANDIEALPPELLRKGRFDEIFFVDLPKPSTRKQIVEIHLRKRGWKPEDFDVDAIAQACDGYSGAEIEQGIVSALHEAYAAKKDLTTAMVIKSLENSPPLSVTMAEKVAELRAWAAERCVPAD